jgi:hypothetical protein
LIIKGGTKYINDAYFEAKREKCVALETREEFIKPLGQYNLLTTRYIAVHDRELQKQKSCPCPLLEAIQHE